MDQKQPDQSVIYEFEMSSSELEARVNAMIESQKAFKDHPVEVFFVADHLMKHIKKTHGVYFNNIDFEKKEIQ